MIRRRYQIGEVARLREGWTQGAWGLLGAREQEGSSLTLERNGSGSPVHGVFHVKQFPAAWNRAMIRPITVAWIYVIGCQAL